MRWLSALLLAAALLLAGFALYKVKTVESATNPRARLIASLVR